MIARKYVIIFLVLYVLLSVSFAYAALLSPFISRLAPAAAAAGAGGSFTIPAKIIAKTSGGANVASWISLLVPGSTAAKVAITVVGVAGVLAADYMESTDWFKNNEIVVNKPGDGTGDFTDTDNMTFPSTFPSSYYIGDISTIIGSKLSGTVIGNGILASQGAAAAARDAYRAANCPTASAGTVPNYYFTMGYYVACPSEPKQIWFYITYWGSGTHDEKVPSQRSKDSVEASLAADLANDDPAAKQSAAAALKVAADAMDNPSHPVSRDTAAANKINSDLSANITANQATNLEAAATPNVGDGVLPGDDETKVETLTPAQIAAAIAAALAGQGLSATQIAAAIAAVQTAQGGLTAAETTAAVSASLQGQGLTAAQIAAAVAAANPALTQTAVQTAVKSALDDETGTNDPVDPAIVIPEKLSLTAVMTTFVDTIKALPIYATLNGITINVSGSSTLCINLPSELGGSQCWNGSNMQDGLNMIGSAFLGLTSIISFIGIFKG